MRDTRALEAGGKARERQPSEPETAPRSPNAQQLLELQRTAGNAAVTRLISATPAPRRLAREVKASEEEPVPLDEAAAAGGTWTLSLAGIADGLRIESFSVPSSGKRGKTTQLLITRRQDKHSTAIQQAAVTGKAIASSEIKGPGVTYKLQNVLVTSYQVGSGENDLESFTLDFTEFSREEK